MRAQTIEIAPLAYMRGRTLSNAFVILDEAQNTTTEQMFMLLTRIGPRSKCVVTGDVTQIDLPSNKRSGLVEALQALKNVPGIGFVYFNDKDVVRHELVRAIINAYQQHRSPANTGGAPAQIAAMFEFLRRTQPREARSRLEQDPAPPRLERDAAQSRVRALDEGDNLRRLRRRAGAS